MTTEEKRIDEEKSSQLDRPEPIPGFPEFGHIPFEGLRNTRDLGGMPTADGRTIAPAKLLRSGALHKASEQDLARLVGDYDRAMAAVSANYGSFDNYLTEALDFGPEKRQALRAKYLR